MKFRLLTEQSWTLPQNLPEMHPLRHKQIDRSLPHKQMQQPKQIRKNLLHRILLLLTKMPQTASHGRKSAALALERVSGATQNDLRMNLDFDDGYETYEGDIIYNQIEYEFEIDAATGKFLEWSEERH